MIRRLAHHLGVDLTEVSGTGPNGRISRVDVERAACASTPVAEAAPPVARAAATDRSASMRRAIAGLMSRSNRDIPHYYVATDVDLDVALTWLASANEASGRSETARCPSPCS